MIIKVDSKKVKITKKDSVNSGEANVHICNFVFSSEYDELIKKAVFTTEQNTSYEATITNNKCDIPIDILYKKGNIKLGVYGYEMQDDTLVLRYSPIPTEFYINQGSYDGDIDISMVVDTSEGNVVSTDILKDKIAFSKGEKIVGTIETETKNVKSSEETQIITPSQNSLIDEIIVQPLAMQEKNITPSGNQQTIEPDANYDALKKVTVDAVSSDVDPNIIPTNIRSGVEILGVEGNLEPDKPDQSKTVNPSTETQTVYADSGYELASVTVNPVTSSIDSDIQANNIKEGVDILGVEGNVVELKGQAKTTTPTTSQQVIEPDANYNGLTRVTVNAIETESKAVKSTNQSQTITPTAGKYINEIIVEPLELESKNVTPTTSAQTITPTQGKDGINQVNVSAVDNTIDSNIQAENIKAGVEILGVQGNYDSQPNLQSKQVTITENTTTTVTPDTGYDGLDEVEVITNIPVSGGAPDWSVIGYQSNEVPQAILDDVAYSKNIYDNWNPAATGLNFKYRNDGKLKYMPLIDTHNVTNMASCFDHCTNLLKVPLLDTSHVTNFSNTFQSCSSLIEIANIDTSSVSYMDYMFSGCEKLSSIPLTTIGTCTRLVQLCTNCYALTSIPMLDMSNITNIQQCFTNCYSLTSIPLFNTSNVETWRQAFNSCSNITELPAFDMSNGRDLLGTFNGCTNLVTVPVFNWQKATNISGIFNGCTNLSSASLNNILASCITATSYTGTKTLARLGLSQAQATTCQTLSNYQDFIDAGWTTRLLERSD